MVVLIQIESFQKIAIEFMNLQKKNDLTRLLWRYLTLAWGCANLYTIAYEIATISRGLAIDAESPYLGHIYWRVVIDVACIDLIIMKIILPKLIAVSAPAFSTASEQILI